jgi:hypothetical protein
MALETLFQASFALRFSGASELYGSILLRDGASATMTFGTAFFNPLLLVGRALTLNWLARRLAWGSVVRLNSALQISHKPVSG